MTHDELRDYIDKFDAAGMVNEPAIKALRAVVELHSPQRVSWAFGRQYCDQCSHWNKPNTDGLKLYPCPTIQTIEKELG